MKSRAKMRLGGALLCAASLGPLPADAQVLDLSTIKCKEFIATEKPTMAIILAWMNAYYKGEDDPPLIDFDQMTRDAGKLGAYCTNNPEIGLMTAADSLFDK